MIEVTNRKSTYLRKIKSIEFIRSKYPEKINIGLVIKTENKEEIEVWKESYFNPECIIFT